MEINKKIQNIAVSVINNEYDAIKNLRNSINSDFVNSVKLILETKGRVVVTGIGKSANIAQKIVATLNSTGTPSVFLHAADAIHGDLGIVTREDIVIAISKSGETPEIKVLIPLLKSMENKIIAIVGNNKSFLANHADTILDVAVSKEACPNNLAPTSSTTAQLVMGDALAVSLLELRGFSSKDFARFHPGGSLGKQMYLRVSDIALNNQIPTVALNSSVNDVIIEISSKRLGATAVIDNSLLVGLITDGDLRRMLEKHSDFTNLSAKDIMTSNPLSIDCNQLVVIALDTMRKNDITQLPVIDGDKYIGVIHLHDILKEGII